VRWALIVAVLAACGRVGFDARVNVDATGDGAIGQNMAVLRPPGIMAGDNFGLSVAISRDGSTVAAGAPLHANQGGSVYLYRRVGSTWELADTVGPDILDVGDQFGWNVALSADGSTLVAGARREDSSSTSDPINNNGVSAGAAYVFERSGTAWQQAAYLKASNVDAGDSFGERVAIADDGNTIAVTAFQEASVATGINGNQGDNTATDAGAVYVFAKSGSTWTQQAYVKATNTDATDGFGYSVSLANDGNTLVAGAYREDSNSAQSPGDDSVSSAGAVYVYTRASTVWTPVAFLKASNLDAGDNFGYSSAVSGDGRRIVVGAEGESSANGNPADNSASASGAAYIYQLGASWQQVSYLKATTPSMDAEFGFHVASTTTGSIVAVGASSESMGTGAAYVFGAQMSSLRAPSPGVGDEFGRAVALSGDGSVLVVGAPFDDGESETAADAGVVYVYY
jgi:hypothetical protein